MKYILTFLLFVGLTANSSVFAGDGIIVRTSRLMEAPSFSSDIVRKKVKVGWAVEIFERKGGWQKVRVIKKDQTGWVRYYQVRTGIDKKSKLEVVVVDEQVDMVIEVISNAAKTAKIGDGNIFVANICNAVRIRTGESGTDAI